MSLVDMRIDVDQHFPSLYGPCAPRRSNSMPFMLIDCYSRRRSTSSSFFYNKLPEQPLKLSVLKLDGSCFEIEVMKSATVAELRQAVEEVFSHIPMRGPVEISWPHVWGHFCLCYNGWKLLDETEYIKSYGIRDGDELQFIRHVSTNYSVTKRRSSFRIITASELPKMLSPLRSNKRKEQIDEEDHCCDDVEDGSSGNLSEKDDDAHEVDGDKWSCILKPWSPYSRLPTTEETEVLKASPPRSTCGFWGRFKKIMQFCGNNRNYRRNA